MTDIELDQIYTALCRAVTEAGQESAQLFLARFALLASLKISDSTQVLDLIQQAALERNGVGDRAATITLRSG